MSAILTNRHQKILGKMSCELSCECPVSELMSCEPLEYEPKTQHLKNYRFTTNQIAFHLSCEPLENASKSAFIS